MFKLELHQNPREIFLHDELLCFIYPSIFLYFYLFLVRNTFFLFVKLTVWLWAGGWVCHHPVLTGLNWNLYTNENETQPHTPHTHTHPQHTHPHTPHTHTHTTHTHTPHTPHTHTHPHHHTHTHTHTQHTTHTNTPPTPTHTHTHTFQSHRSTRSPPKIPPSPYQHNLCTSLSVRYISYLQSVVLSVILKFSLFCVHSLCHSSLIYQSYEPVKW